MLPAMFQKRSRSTITKFQSLRFAIATILGLLACCESAALAVDTEFTTDVNYFENAAFVDGQGDLQNSGSSTSSVSGDFGSATAQADENGSLFSLSVVEKDASPPSDGSILTSSSPEPAPQDPLADVESNSTATWYKMITNTSAAPVNYTATFNVIQPLLEVYDMTGGYEEKSSSPQSASQGGDQFVADLGLQIKIDGVIAYDIAATLKAVGTSEEFSGVVVNANPQGAALPVFVDLGDSGMLHKYQAADYSIMLDIGQIDPNETFEIEYLVRSLATSPGTNDVESFFVQAQISDPFDIQGGPNTPVLIEQTSAAQGTPEPSTVVLAILACSFGCIGSRRRRRR